jgi:hypothetical protein
MDRIEILTRLALILRRMDRLADLATRDKEDLDSLREERTRLHDKWQELAQQLPRSDGVSDQSAADRQLP